VVSSQLNIEPNHTTMAGHSYEHDCAMASAFGFLGSIDSNTGDTSLGWDTDQFPMNLKDCAALVQIILAQGGLAPGGLNFDCKVRRESTELEDMFISHIASMDVFAVALRKMAKLHQDKALSKLIAARYSSYDSGIGASIESGKTSFKELEQYMLKQGDKQEPQNASGHQEMYEAILNNYLHK
jgi:xylose isomerase